MKNFEKELKSTESIDTVEQNDDFKAHLTHVKSRYQKLIKLSNLYSQRLDHFFNL